MSDQIYEGWTVVFRSGTDYEADLVRDRLDDAGIEAVVLTQRDHAFNLNLGDMALVHVLVPPARVEEARQLLAQAPPSDAELEEAALAAGPAPDAHDPEEEAALDSGIESIRFPGGDDDRDD
ncbi:MAG: DUF2007 domain-containing protein [Rhodothermales bacterium]|nr:DUF2007 domain-containing protein [Rhodothermales bacterium]